MEFYDCVSGSRFLYGGGMGDGFKNEFHGNIDHECIQQNIRLNDQRLDRIRRIRELQKL